MLMEGSSKHMPVFPTGREKQSGKGSYKRRRRSFVLDEKKRKPHGFRFSFNTRLRSGCFVLVGTIGFAAKIYKDYLAMFSVET